MHKICLISKKPFETLRRIPRKLRREMETHRLANGVRLIVCQLFATWRETGSCSFNQRVVEHWLGSGQRKILTAFCAHLERIGMMACTGKSCPSSRSIPRVFTFNTCANPYFITTNMSGSGPSGTLAIDGWRTVSFDQSLLLKQDDSWTEWCVITGNTKKLDCRGETAWGAAVLRGLSSFALPDVSAVDREGLSDRGSKWLDLYFSRLRRGLSPVVCWKRERLFHALTGCPQRFRKLGKFIHKGQWEDAVSCDVHAMYWCALASMLDDSEEKTRLVEALQNREFYSGLAVECGQQADGDFKRQTNMQCLFWPQHWAAHARPVWLALERLYPALCELIKNQRGTLGVGGLSDLLMSIESRIVALGAFLKCSHACPCFPIHDCIICPKSEADRVRQAIQEQAERLLGFRPQVKVEDG